MKWANVFKKPDAIIDITSFCFQSDKGVTNARATTNTYCHYDKYNVFTNVYMHVDDRTYNKISKISQLFDF